MNTMQRIALALVIIGAINWGLIGFLNFDLVATIFGGQQSAISRIIYSLVGLSGLYALTLYFIHDYDDEPIQHSELNYGTEFSDEYEIDNRNNFDKKE